MVRHGDNGMPVATEAMRGKVMHSRFEGAGCPISMRRTTTTPSPCGARRISSSPTTVRKPIACSNISPRAAPITTPIGMQPWGDYYGKLTDKFGVQWMINLPLRSGS